MPLAKPYYDSKRQGIFMTSLLVIFIGQTMIYFTIIFLSIELCFVLTCIK
jgi:hypothetical protein